MDLKDILSPNEIAHLRQLQENESRNFLQACEQAGLDIDNPAHRGAINELGINLGRYTDIKKVMRAPFWSVIEDGK